VSCQYVRCTAEWRERVLPAIGRSPVVLYLFAIAGLLALAGSARVAVAQGTKSTTTTMTVSGFDPYGMDCTVVGPWTAPGTGPTGTVTFTDATSKQAIGTAMLTPPDSTARFGAPVYSPGVPGQVMTTGDFNHDGKLDVTLADQATSELYVMLGNGNGTFQNPKIYPLPSPGGP
jgi:hypothetical protein